MSKRSLAKTILVAGSILLSAAAFTAAAQDLRGLAGGQDALGRVNPAPENVKQSTPDRGFSRAYRQQPPLIPHTVENYQITATNNACMSCHDWPGHIDAKAPKVSETHYVDRAGVRLDKIAGTRYFCQQCHVPQADAKPLVNNTFRNATQVR